MKKNASGIYFRIPPEKRWQLACEEKDFHKTKQAGGEFFASFKDKSVCNETFACNAHGNYYDCKGIRVTPDEAWEYLLRGTLFLGPALPEHQTP